MKNLFKIFKTGALQDVDNYTIKHEPVTSLDLMERAALQFTNCLQEIFPHESHFTVIAGSGNNGGDGFVTARLLKERGADVNVYFAVPKSGRVAPDCIYTKERFREIGGECVEIRECGSIAFDSGGVIIDALFGAGLNRPIEGWPGSLIEAINLSGLPIIAIDIPSGLLGEDNSDNRGAIVQATYTLTFQFPKLSFMFSENEKYVGEFKVLDIGLHPEALKNTPSPYYYLNRSVVTELLPVWSKFVHKGDLGHALLVAGSWEMSGAAILSAGGAIRSGCGLLTVHVPAFIKELLHESVPEALVQADANDYNFTGVTDLSKYSAIGIGPGLGISSESQRALFNLLSGWHGKIVLDADALNMLALAPEALELLPKGAILTPHPGEFSRLVGKSVNDFDRLNKLTIFAQRYGVYIVLKGAHTTIATPDGRCFFNTTGNPGMAKGGSGDVLTGIITALLAGGLEPLEAAIIGVYVHGMAGDLASEIKGMRGMRSGDLVDFLGEAWRILESHRDCTE